jgi:hypothetical protein
MKKKLVLISATAITLFFACKKESIVQQPLINGEINVNLINSASKLHNDGMDFIVKEYRKKHPNTSPKRNEITHDDSLEIINFVEQYAYIYLQNKSIDTISFDSTKVNFSTTQLFNLLDNNHVNASPELQAYNEKLLSLSTQEFSIEQLNIEINKVIVEARQTIANETEFNKLLCSAGVLKGSYEYWQTPHSLTGRTMKGKTALIGTDVGGAIDGGLWGASVGGPWGAAAGAVSGGLIASCSSFIIGELW